MNGTVLYTVYDHPKDYPDHFVVRRWEVDAFSNVKATAWVRCAHSLENIRKSLPMGVTRIMRDETDDPVIVETWIL